MKFLFHTSNQMIINSDCVERFSVHNVNAAYVEAKLSNGVDKVTLKEFNAGDREKNFVEAKKYLTDLIKNCKLKVIFYNDGLEAVNVAFVEKIFFANCEYIIAKTSTEEIILKAFNGTAEEKILLPQKNICLNWQKF